MNKTNEEQHAAERIAIADRLLVVGLVIAGVVLSALGDERHATMLFSGALGALAPVAMRASAGANVARLAPLALGVGATLLVGCGAATLPTIATIGATIKPVVCHTARVTVRACDATSDGLDAGERP